MTTFVLVTVITSSCFRNEVMGSTGLSKVTRLAARPTSTEP
jgi:hypothetical protein